MDAIDIYKTLGLTDKEIKELITKIFENEESLQNSLSADRKLSLNSEKHQSKVMNYLKAFKDLAIPQEDINETIEIIYAKIMFLASIGIEINNQNKKYILLDEEKFYHAFGITYEELTNLYPYQEYEENINKRWYNENQLQHHYGRNNR